MLLFLFTRQLIYSIALAMFLTAAIPCLAVEVEVVRTLGSDGEIQEVRNAVAAYEQLPAWNPQNEADLKAANGILMRDLMVDAGTYRKGGVVFLDQVVKSSTWLLL